MPTEDLREWFQPPKIRLLLVGESPPRNEDQFFYRGGNMQKFTMKAFEKAHSRTFSDSKEFLCYFKNCGCFLDDLSHIPVFEMQGRQRKNHLRDQVEELSERINDFKPLAVVGVGLGIKKYIFQAAELSEWQAKQVIAIPFAGRGHQNTYVEQLAALIRSWVLEESVCEHSSCID
ncbi:MAG: hypothetical protein R6V84_03910 [Desulfobacterales bacterium]